jgi:hypothetical protein
VGRKYPGYFQSVSPIRKYAYLWRALKFPITSKLFFLGILSASYSIVSLSDLVENVKNLFLKQS